jgi:hypothetical protein
VKLVPFSSEYLRMGEPLPFGLRDTDGRLLLKAGLSIINPAHLDDLKGVPLFADEAEAGPWMRRLAVAFDTVLRNGGSMKNLAEARPEPAPREASPATVSPLTLGEQWDELVLHLDATLRDARPGTEWPERLMAVHERARQLAQKRPDASLYHMVYEAGLNTRNYSSRHGLMTMLMGEQAAIALGWPQDRIDSLSVAALTMNLAILRLQDQMAVSEPPLDAKNRALIDNHADTSARMLQAAGVSDAMCVAVVRGHHDQSDDATPLAELSPERQIARLLRRVDMFAAKISRRNARAPMSPVQAAREACLGAGGVPDEVGGALLRAVGLYPPGSFVELANGEMGIVLARGRRANLPFVATLISASGNVLGEPALRDTLDRRFAVKSALAPGVVKVRPPHERLLAMR